MKNNFYILPGENPCKKVEGVHFLFPLKGFCVGMKKEYDIQDLEKDSFVYVNRMLDEESILAFERILSEIEKKCVGIVFEDLGILEVLETHHSSLKKVFFATHGVCSLQTALCYLKEVDQVILSPDITLEESQEILKQANDIGIFLYGHLPFMYSRRSLLKNYAQNFELEQEENLLHLEESVSKKRFFAVENEYGTVIYDSRVYDARELLEDASFGLISLEYEVVEDLEQWLKDFLEGMEVEDSTTGFLHQKTIYKLPPKKEEV